jgi:Ca-activated chloride channel family protein
LKYEDGEYEFVFPMTVAPRYIPASVKDAAKISPPVAKTRAGHDVSMEINLDAGVPVEVIRSNSHEIIVLNSAPHRAKVSLKNENEIPNKDFVLRYDVTGKRIENAVLTHRDERGGFFTLILQPPDQLAAEDITPKEIVFVLDTSGSMSGFPIEKAKEAMKLSLDNLYPDDTFNLITFAGETAVLFDKPVPATQANLEKAQEFLASRSGAGGTEMMTAIKAALAPSDAQDHIRIV